MIDKDDERRRKNIKEGIREAKDREDKRTERVRNGIGEAIEKDRRLQAQLLEVCEKTSRSQLEVFSYASEYIKGENKELYDKMNDSNTSKTERDWNKFKFLIENVLLALAGHQVNRKNK